MSENIRKSKVERIITNLDCVQNPFLPPDSFLYLFLKEIKIKWARYIETKTWEYQKKSSWKTYYKPACSFEPTYFGKSLDLLIQSHVSFFHPRFSKSLKSKTFSKLEQNHSFILNLYLPKNAVHTTDLNKVTYLFIIFHT